MLTLSNTKVLQCAKSMLPIFLLRGMRSGLCRRAQSLTKEDLRKKSAARVNPKKVSNLNLVELIFL